MSRAVLALLVMVAGVQCSVVPPPAQPGHIVVDQRPPLQWAVPRDPSVLLDEGDRNIISHEVSDPDVGPDGITALKDSELGACFLYKYMKPLIIPRVQRHFYAKTKTATILLNPHDKTRFRVSVGPAVDNLCNMVRSYWLDDNMFFLYMTNKLRSRFDPPPPNSNDQEEPEEDELSAALIFPTPPPLQEVHNIRTPPPLPHQHHVMKTPPPLVKSDQEIKLPPGLPHEMKVPPGFDHVKATPPMEKTDNDPPSPPH